MLMQSAQALARPPAPLNSAVACPARPVAGILPLDAFLCRPTTSPEPRAAPP